MHSTQHRVRGTSVQSKGDLDQTLKHGRGKLLVDDEFVPTVRLLGGLAEAGGELPPACLVVAGVAEVREGVRGLDERVVGVEPALTAAVATVAEPALMAPLTPKVSSAD